MGLGRLRRSHLLRALTARPDAVYIHAANGENMLRVLAGADSKSPMPKFVAVDDVHRMDDNRQAGLFALYNRWRESAATGRAFALAVAGDRAPLSMPLRGTCAPAWAGTWCSAWIRCPTPTSWPPCPPRRPSAACTWRPRSSTGC